MAIICVGIVGSNWDGGRYYQHLIKIDMTIEQLIRQVINGIAEISKLGADEETIQKMTDSGVELIKDAITNGLK